MKEKRVESITQVDMSDLIMPQIAVYKHPEDFLEECVARIFDMGDSTDTIMVKKTVTEIAKDIGRNTNMIFMPRGADDVPSLVGVWT